MIGSLPHPIPQATWHKVTPEIEVTSAYWPEIKAAALDAARKPGWNPRTVQMGGHMMAIDYSFEYGTHRVSAYKTAIIADHPFLATLPSNAPRQIRHMYRKDVRLRYLRAKDAWAFLQDFEQAEAAARQYNAAIRDNT